MASRAGFFNVGLPGQALAGWTSAVWFALSFPELPKVVSVFCTVIIGLVAGGIAGAIPGILRAYLGTSEVIVTIMMNYIILYVANNIVRFGLQPTCYVHQKHLIRSQPLQAIKQNSYPL